MDSTTNNINPEKKWGLDDIIKSYNNLTYLDLYGTSIVAIFILSIILFAIFAYFTVLSSKEQIAKEWSVQRCKPQNMPFAGLINKPDDKTAFEYTNENFQYCVQDILKQVTMRAFKPFEYMISTLTSTAVQMTDSMQQSRGLMGNIRNQVSIFADEVMQRVLNVIIPLQKMFIALMDIFNKIQGVMTDTLYTILGSYYTLQALMGSIVELIIKLLIALVIIIVGLWVTPFTWPVAASMSSVFVGISVPLAVIMYFMSDVLHIKTSSIPKLRCFDENTPFIMKDGSIKRISELKVDDILQDGDIVTATIQVLAEDLEMFSLNDIIVSESHIVNHKTSTNKDNWIPVKKHPLSIKINHYDKPYLYCINTKSKTINLNGLIFTDWDEIYGSILTQVQNYNKPLYKEYNNNIYVLMDDNTKKQLKDVCLKDILKEKNIVYGIVQLDKKGLKQNLLVTNNIFQIEFDNTIHLAYDFNYMLDKIISYTCTYK